MNKIGSDRIGSKQNDESAERVSKRRLCVRVRARACTFIINHKWGNGKWWLAFKKMCMCFTWSRTIMGPGCAVSSLNKHVGLNSVNLINIIIAPNRKNMPNKASFRFLYTNRIFVDFQEIFRFRFVCLFLFLPKLCKSMQRKCSSQMNNFLVFLRKKIYFMNT